MLDRHDILSARGFFILDDENGTISISLYHSIYIYCFDFHNVYGVPGHALCNYHSEGSRIYQ